MVPGEFLRRKLFVLRNHFFNPIIPIRVQPHSCFWWRFRFNQVSLLIKCLTWKLAPTI